MKDLLNKIVSNGATDGEIFYKETNSKTISFKSNILKGSSESQSTGVALRMIKDGKLSFSTSNDIDRFDAILENCLEINPFSSPVEFDFINKHNEESILIPENDVLELSDEKLIEDGRRIVSEITKEYSNVKTSVEFEINSSTVEIANTKGFAGQYKKDTLGFTAGCSFIKENSFLHCYDGQLLLNSNYDVDRMISYILDDLRISQNIVNPDSGVRPVIFTPKFLNCALIPLMLAVSGKNVTDGVSPLVKKVGTQIFDDKFTIIDDATRIGALNTTPFDDEGTPSQRTEVISNGNLKGFLHSLKTANKMNVEPTGNGYKLGRFFPKPELDAEPAPYVTNLHIQPGTSLLKDMISDLKDGIIIDDVIGFFMGNLMNGEITGNIGTGYHVQNGKIVGRFSGKSISFNIYELFKNNLVDLSSDTKNTPFFFMHGYNPTPYAMFKDLNIV